MAANVINLSGLFYSMNIESSRFISVRKSIAYIAGTFIVIFTLNLSLYAQDWRWPEKPVNLQVLGEEYTGRRLGGKMREFTIGLGVRCQHCHVGEAGQPLSSIDFASDANPNKDRAREMLRMVNDIRGHLGKIEPSGNNRVGISCNTCHRGITRPISLSAQLGETFRAEGIEASLAQYSELKEKYYGTGAYQFTESILNDLGYAAVSDDPKGALKMFKLNAKEYPKSGNVWDSLAETYMNMGDNKKAKKYYKRSLKMNPNNQNAKDMLKKL